MPFFATTPFTKLNSLPRCSSCSNATNRHFHSSFPTTMRNFRKLSLPIFSSNFLSSSATDVLIENFRPFSSAVFKHFVPIRIKEHSLFPSYYTPNYNSPITHKEQVRPINSASASTGSPDSTKDVFHNSETKSQEATVLNDSKVDPFSKWMNNPRIFSCSEVGKNLRIAVLMSGGVDSSVALRLLTASGHKCTAFYIKIWFQEDFENYWSECPWEDDLRYAEAVCNQANVELRVIHLTDEYWNRVVSYCVSEVKAGRTPNPDILCNSRIKFGAFYDQIDFSEFDLVASGHYARVNRITNSFNNETKVELLLSEDEFKDQTYFLSHLTQQQLSRALFPIGCLKKPEVRTLAFALNLPNCQRKDSQGICFLGKLKFSEFISRHLGESHGKIIEAETGKHLGNHRGLWFLTIGQRQGLGLSEGPWYVVAKSMEHNVILVSRDYYSPEKRRRWFRAGEFNWISEEIDMEKTIRCKLRHGPKFYTCGVEFETLEDGRREAMVTLSEDDQGIACGQYVAFYQDQKCLGSGVILDAFHIEYQPSMYEQNMAKKVASILSELSVSDN